jgi:hypothetical protein
LQLTRPSLHSYINAIVKRERLDLDEAAFGAADSIFVKALEGGKHSARARRRVAGVVGKALTLIQDQYVSVAESRTRTPKRVA